MKHSASLLVGLGFCGLGLLLTPGSVSAAVLIHDGFAYAGDLIPPGGGNGQGSGLGWDGPWTSGLGVGGFPVISTSLLAPTVRIPPTGGSIEQFLLPNRQYHAYRFVQQPRTVPSGGSLWLSAIVSTGGDVNGSMDVIFAFHPPFSPGLDVRIGQYVPTIGGPLTWVIQGLPGSGDTYGPAVVPNSPTLIVAEVSKDAAGTAFTLRYWINPSPPVSVGDRPPEPPLGTQVLSSGFDLNVLNHVMLVARVNTLAIDPLRFGFDEIRIGDDCTAITGVAPHVNREPVADSLAVAGDEDSLVTGIVTALDPDPLDLLSFERVTTPSHGMASMNPDGSFTYTPEANYHGPDSFTFRASDGELYSAPATVSITVRPVNDAPVASNLAVSGDEDTSIAGTVTASDPDQPGPITFESVVLPAHGTVSMNPSGSFTYVPSANYYGPDSFTFRASDGELFSVPATVSITVRPVNDAPVASSLAVSGDEDTLVTGTVTASDADRPGPLTFERVTTPSHGMVSMNPDGSFTYTPEANYHGPDSFTFRASDGELYSAPATVSITVRPVNDAPVANAASYTVEEDTILLGAVTGTDPDGPSALVFRVATPPLHGTLTLSPDGSFDYRPSVDYSGTDSFTFQTTDSLLSAVATVSITVTPGTSVNRPPNAVAHLQPDADLDGGDEEIILISVNGIDAPVAMDGSLSSDPDGNSLVYSWFVSIGGGAMVALISPTTEAVASSRLPLGSHTVFLQVSDGRASSALGVKTVRVITVSDAINHLIDVVEAANIRRTYERRLTRLLEVDLDLFAGSPRIPGVTPCEAGVAGIRVFKETVAVLSSPRSQRLTGVTDAVAARLNYVADQIIEAVRCE